jgi:hypothetical protein
MAQSGLGHSNVRAVVAAGKEDDGARSASKCKKVAVDISAAQEISVILSILFGSLNLIKRRL